MALQHRPVLEIETYDVRPLARLLRGIAFQQRAVVTLSGAGLAFQVEDTRAMVAVAYVSKALFDKFSFFPKTITRRRSRRYRPGASSNPFNDSDGPQTPSRRGTTQSQLPGYDDADSSSEEEEEDDPASCVFEVNLSNLSECLNIYGHANIVNSSGTEDFGFQNGRSKRFGGGAGGNEGDLSKGNNNNNSAMLGSLGNPHGCTSLLMTWIGPGWPLKLTLRDDEPNTPMTSCELTLLTPEESNEEQFNQDQMLFHVIMKATWLKEAIGDLDSSCSKITIIAGPPLPEEERLREEQLDQHGPNGPNGSGRKARERAGIFRLQAKGDFGTTELDYPNDRDVMDVFICSEKLSFSYNFGLFSQANRALQAAIKVSLRIDDEGFLSLQMMMPPPVGKRLDNSSDSGIIEFKLTALQEED